MACMFTIVSCEDQNTNLFIQLQSLIEHYKTGLNTIPAFQPGLLMMANTPLGLNYINYVVLVLVLGTFLRKALEMTGCPGNRLQLNHIKKFTPDLCRCSNHNVMNTNL